MFRHVIPSSVIFSLSVNPHMNSLSLELGDFPLRALLPRRPCENQPHRECMPLILIKASSQGRWELRNSRHADLSSCSHFFSCALKGENVKALATNRNEFLIKASSTLHCPVPVAVNCVGCTGTYPYNSCWYPQMRNHLLMFWFKTGTIFPNMQD